MSILLSASTCEAEFEQGEHLFKISDYSIHRGMDVGSYIQSSVFTVGGHDWCLHYYPDGSTEDSKDDITIDLELMEMDRNADTARVSSAISFFHWKTNRFSSPVVSTPTVNLSHRYDVVTHHMNRGEMEASGYVVEDRLTIKCAMTVFKEPYVIAEEEAELPANSHVEVPPSDLTEHLAKLLDAKEIADVTLEVQEEEFPAHKLVLAMRSPVFKAELYGSMRGKDLNRIVIDNMKPAIFKALLRFIYTDSLPAMDDLEKKEMAGHLLVAADRYGMERLKLICESILSKKLDVESVATTLDLADQHSCSGLKDDCIRFIASCTKINDVMTSKGYNLLKKTCPDTAIDMREKASRLRET
ncbi:unnamed protein product [Alopecurus aequalis]